jgi:hypothetical protein
MKRTMILAAVFALWGANALQLCASAQTIDRRRCNDRLIEGTYGFTIEGQKLAGPGPVGPQVGVAITTFDGGGNLSQLDSVVIGGSQVADFTHPPAAGTYSVNANCTGTFTIEFQDGRPPVTVDFAVVDDGREIDTVVLPPPGSVGSLATRSIGKRRFSPASEEPHE